MQVASNAMKKPYEVSPRIRQSQLSSLSKQPASQLPKEKHAEVRNNIEYTKLCN